MTNAASRVALSADLIAAGYSYDELRRLRRAGELERLRRGAYRWAVGGPLERVDLHRELVLATCAVIAPDAVVSHLSAAVLHGLPVWSDRLTHVQVTRPAAAAGKRRGHVHTHTAELHASEVTWLHGVPLTSVARTVVDLGRTLPLEQAVAAGDAALRSGLDTDELSDVLKRSRGRRGVAGARRATDLLDGRSESPWESLSRVVFHRHGLPPPTLQYEVFDRDGFLVGRADFCWEAQRTLGEFDGKGKYGPLVPTGQTSADVTYQEKRREDSMRDLNWEVVRWSAADLRQERVVVDRLLRAFARGAR